MELLDNINKIHTTPLGIKRIKQNLNLEEQDIVDFLKNKIRLKNTNIYKKGKNWYCEIDNVKIIVNSYTIITLYN